MTRTRPPLRATHTYCTLEIDPASYADIRQRILDIDRKCSIEGHPPCHDYQYQYICDYGEETEVIAFGDVGLIPEKRPALIALEKSDTYLPDRPAWRVVTSGWALSGPYCVSRGFAVWEWAIACLERVFKNASQKS